MKTVIVTVGPSILGEKEKFQKFHRPQNIYRINGAHVDSELTHKTVEEIRSMIPDAKIMLDLPGNKIRTSKLNRPFELKVGTTFEIFPHQLNYPEFFKHVRKGDDVWAKDSTLKFKVLEVSPEKVQFQSESEGTLESNKGLHVRGIHRDLPFLFDKDQDLIKAANQLNLYLVSLSFVRTPEDIEEARKLIHPSVRTIPKVETLQAVIHLDEILKISDWINVDRGDLSTEIGLNKVPAYQKFIVERANFFNKKCFLATQFLKNMETNPLPTIAEMCGLYDTFKMGVYGIQLSEETAVGKFPFKCLEVIQEVLETIEAENRVIPKESPSTAPTV